MEVDQEEKYLVTGDINGMVKIWNIADYCVNFSSKAISIMSERNTEKITFNLMLLLFLNIIVYKI